MSIKNRLVASCAVAAAALVNAPDASAQTDYSLRTQSLSLRFGGVVEDLLSDAFLNPARLSAFSGTQVYVAKNPRRTYGLLYPWPEDPFLSAAVLPPEGYSSFSSSSTYSSAPYELTLFTGLGAGTRGSFSLAVFSDAGDSFFEDDEVAAFSSSSVRIIEWARGSRQEQTSFRLQGALSTGDSPGDRSLGLRLLLERNTADRGHVDSRTELWLQPVNEASIDSRFSRWSTEFTQLNAVVTGGIFRPGAMLREFMISAGYSRRDFDTETMQTRSEDNDFDSNGVGMGGPVYQFYSRARLTGERSYDGPLVQSRVHVDLTDALVFTADGFYIHRTGSGPAMHQYNTVLNDSGGRHENSVGIPYDYDGTDSRYGVSATIGYREELTPSVLFALGANIDFTRDNFSENGNGRMRVDVNGTPPISVEVDYTQKAWRLDDRFWVRLPAGLEWLPIDPLALRLGVELYGYRHEETKVIRREPDTSSLPLEYQRVSEFQSGQTVDDIFVQLNTGLGVNLAERLFVDLLYQSQSIVSLASYGFVSLRYQF